MEFQLGSISIFRRNLLLFISKAIIICCLALIYSCECPADVNTKQQNTPNQFARINIFNYTSSMVEITSNNVFIENQNLNSDGYSSYFAGNSILTFKTVNIPIFSSAISLNVNSDYSLVFYEKSEKYLLNFSEDKADIRTRLFNCSKNPISFKLNNQDIVVLPNDNFVIDFIPPSLNISNGLLSKEIDFSNFQSENINNIIFDNDLNTEYFTSF